MKKFLIFCTVLSLSLANLCFAEEKIDKNTPEETKIEIPEKPEITLNNVSSKNFTNNITLRGLNKITAKTFELKTQINKNIIFEKLDIMPIKCWKSPPTQKPENKALLKVYEKKINGKTELIFYGWMFSSSPGLSALEHPMYDITVVDCNNQEITNDKL